MEEGLLAKERGDRGEVLRWGVFVEEVKRVGFIAGPMVAVTVSQYLLQVISVMMVGHLGELALSSAAIASSLTGVTGFSLLLGMASALETLCGQAYGAQQYRKLGSHTYGAILSLNLVCVPLSLIWVSMGKLLSLIGQDPAISREAVFRSGLGNVGAALAISISYWLNVIFLVLYMKFSSSCGKTRVPLSMEAFRGIGEFVRLAVPSAVMICLEWWSFELLVLLSGLLPNPELETSVLSVCLTTISLLYTIPYGVGAAASTRVSNELGAGNPQAARTAVCAVMFLSLTETTILSTSLYAGRYIWSYAYSNEKEVVNYVKGMAPLISMSVVMDSLQGVLSGVARGCGWQHIGAYVNLGAFYLAGVPIAAFLGFRTPLRGKGLWIGILTGSTLQSAMLSLITIFTNWEKQAIKAKERIFEGRFSIENGLN
uniref:Protein DETOXIFICATION n=1 Tax=Nelumbo nucifera TaxID=4432 RepID=A0A822YM05_NELNU|nr:TPA_asm: hypothetical protein HUJ06_010787 [Nelumbo nucifera]